MVDALAKMSALEAQFLPQVVSLIESAEAAVQYTAMLLGRVTYEANHHCSTTTDSFGVTTNKWLRDSVDAPKRPKRRLSPKGVVDNAASSSTDPPKVIEPVMLRPMKAPRTGSRTPTVAQRARLLEEAQLMRRVDEIGSALTVPDGRTPATERIAALRRRICSQRTTCDM